MTGNPHRLAGPNRVVEERRRTDSELEQLLAAPLQHAKASKRRRVQDALNTVASLRRSLTQRNILARFAELPFGVPIEELLGGIGADATASAGYDDAFPVVSVPF